MGETNIFKVLADSQRRDILIMLRNERLNAGEIAEKLQITPAATIHIIFFILFFLQTG